MHQRGMSDKSMADKLILPQNTRLMGVLLGFIGGSLDVFCHIQYHSLVATQTGNILLLISDWHDSHVINTMLRFYSIIFFSLGFLFALHVKEYRKTAYWRVKMLLPLFIGTLILPFFSRFPLLEVPFIAFGTGMMMLTFTGSLIEDHPYVIFMTSGNYRKMLTALYRIVRGEGDVQEYRRQALNYGIVVGSFVLGAISLAVSMHFFHEWSIWIVSFNLFLIMSYYIARVKQLDLQDENI